MCVILMVKRVLSTTSLLAFFVFSAEVLLECLEGRMVGFAGEVGLVLKQAKAFVLPFKDNQLS